MKKTLTIILLIIFTISCSRPEIKTDKLEKEITLRAIKTKNKIEKLKFPTVLNEKVLETLKNIDKISNNLKYVSSIDYANRVKNDLFKVFVLVDNMSFMIFQIDNMKFKDGSKLFQKKEIKEINNQFIELLDGLNYDLLIINKITNQELDEIDIDKTTITEKSNKVKFKRNKMERLYKEYLKKQ